jgi:hypothetical protein
MPRDDIIENRLFGIAGDIRSEAFAYGEPSVRGYKCAIAGCNFLREIDGRICVDFFHESASCDRQAANLSN